MTSETLMPCPFCGGKARLVINNANLNSKYGGMYPSSVHITCMKNVVDTTTCHVMHAYQYSKCGELVNDEMIESAIKSWNTRATIDGIIAGQDAPVPEGYKLVPIEPTDGMCLAGSGFSPNAVRDNEESEKWYQAGLSVARDTYKAMLSVAPTPAQLPRIDGLEKDIHILVAEAERVKKERDELAKEVVASSRIVEALKAENEELKAKLEKTNWQPIDTAPRDEAIDTCGFIDGIHGFEFVRVTDDYISSNTPYPLVSKDFEHSNGLFGDYTRQFWMSLPQPPKETK